MFEQFVKPERLAKFERVLAKRSDQYTLVLDRVHKPHNIAAVLRSADAFGYTNVHLIGIGSLYHPEVSRGAERWVALNHHQDEMSAVRLLKSQGYEFVALAPDRGTQVYKLHELPFDKKLAFILGNEHDGISSYLLEQADYQASIPMYGFVESLNISVAAALCMYTSRLVTEGERPVSPLSESDQLDTKALWAKRDIIGERLTKIKHE